MKTRWPEIDTIDEAAEADTEWLKRVISAVRSARTELGLAPGKPMPLLIQRGSSDDLERLARFGPFIQRLARIESVNPVDGLNARQALNKGATASQPLVGSVAAAVDQHR